MSAAEIRETACRFGEGGRLIGVVTEPAGPPAGKAVLVTAGLTPKFGPFRLYAQLARRLAADGWRVLRFDLGGIGDSAACAGTAPLRERTNAELRAAVDRVLEGAPGPGPLLLCGLCSGAEDSFLYARQDARVTDLALLDAFGYKTAGWAWRDGLIRAARRGLAASGLIHTYGSAQEASLVDYRHLGREECVAGLRALVDRGVRMHFVYTGGMRESFNHKGQFRAMFGDVDFRGLAAVDFFPQLRHTQVLEQDRRLVIESISREAASRLARCRA